MHFISDMQVVRRSHSLHLRYHIVNGLKNYHCSPCKVLVIHLLFVMVKALHWGPFLKCCRPSGRAQ